MGAVLADSGDIIHRVKGTIKAHGLLDRKDRVVVAVSGGPDSVCLLDILYQLRGPLEIQLLVAHFDHGLRPGADANETLFVASLAQSLGLTFESGKASAGLGTGPGSLEEAARNERYRFLQEVKVRHGAQKIAVGHTLTDQAETFLMRLLRGSGPRGLSGIQPHRRDGIIRPLMEVTHGEVEAYLHERGMKYVEDPSNLNPRYLRNRIRMELLPLLRAYQPQIEAILGWTAGILRKDEQRLQGEAKAWVDQACAQGGRGEMGAPISAYLGLNESLRHRVTRELIARVGGTLRRVNRRHLEAVRQVASGKRPQGEVHLPGTMIVRKVYDQLVFSKAAPTQAVGDCPIEGPGTYELEAWGGVIRLEEMKPDRVKDMGASPWTAFLDADRLSYPLGIRNPRPGDRMIPLGMKGHKKIKDLFIDLKVPAPTRKSTPVLTQRDRPIWVCGFRIDDRYKVTSRTRRVLKVTLKRHSDEEVKSD
jgi:tRNA(Ile)-lysidine synthase